MRRFLRSTVGLKSVMTTGLSSRQLTLDLTMFPQIAQESALHLFPEVVAWQVGRQENANPFLDRVESVTCAATSFAFYNRVAALRVDSPGKRTLARRAFHHLDEVFAHD